MKRVTLFTILLFVAGSLAAQDISGYWEGKIAVSKTDSLTVGLQLEYQADTLYAELDSPDQYYSGQPVSNLRFVDSILSFQVPDFKLSYEGRISADGQRFTGVCTQYGKKFDCVLSQGAERKLFPRPQTPEQEALFKRCLEDNLKVPETWETQLSANGNNQETWEKLIADGKVGYMALLRNLRNILTAQPRNIRSAMRTLSDPGAVHRSKQLPFRFLSAYKSVSGIGGSQVFDVLEDAVEYSLDNLPKIPGTTVLAVDTSGSMSSPISRNSDIRCCEVGMMLGVMANRLCENAIFYTFDTVLNKKALSTRNGILYTVLHEACAGGGTRMNLPFERMIQDRVKADRIIIISDNQCNGGYWNKPVQALADEYRRQTGNDIWVHAIDLQGTYTFSKDISLSAGYTLMR